MTSPPSLHERTLFHRAAISTVSIEQRQVVALRGGKLAAGDTAGHLFELAAHDVDFLASGQRRDLAHGLKRASDGERAGALQMAPAVEIEVASTERLAVEPMVQDEVDGDPHHRFGRQALILLEHERRLKVVVKGHDERSVRGEVAGRAVAIEVDEDSPDRVAMVDDPRVADGVGDRILVSVGPNENLLELAVSNDAGDDVG